MRYELTAVSCSINSVEPVVQHTLFGYQSEITSVAISPDNSFIITVSGDAARIWVGRNS